MSCRLWLAVRALVGRCAHVCPPGCSLVHCRPRRATHLPCPARRRTPCPLPPQLSVTGGAWGVAFSLDMLMPSPGSSSPWGHVAVSGDIFGCHSWGVVLLPSRVEASGAADLNRTERPPAESGLASGSAAPPGEPLPLVARRLCHQSKHSPVLSPTPMLCLSVEVFSDRLCPVQSPTQWPSRPPSCCVFIPPPPGSARPRQAGAFLDEPAASSRLGFVTVKGHRPAPRGVCLESRLPRVLQDAPHPRSGCGRVAPQPAACPGPRLPEGARC